MRSNWRRRLDVLDALAETFQAGECGCLRTGTHGVRMAVCRTDAEADAAEARFAECTARHARDDEPLVIRLATFADFQMVAQERASV